MICVAILDDGVNIPQSDLVASVEVTDDLQIAEREIQQGMESHGTICYRIIKKYAPSCKAFSVKVLDARSRRCSVSKLIAGLQWCFSQRIPIVHLSLGSIEYEDFSFISRQVNKMIAKGIVVIAACHNRNIVSYPASLYPVIGVKADASLKDDEFYYNPNRLDGIDFSASSRHLLKKETVYMSPVANSYAAPVVTAAVCNLLKDRPFLNRQDLMTRLCQNSKRKDGEYQPPYYRPDGMIQRAIVVNILTEKTAQAEAESLRGLPLLFDSVQVDWPPNQWNNSRLCIGEKDRDYKSEPNLVINLCGSFLSPGLTKSIVELLDQRKGKQTLLFAQHHRNHWREILARYLDAILMGDSKSGESQTNLPEVSVPVVVVTGFEQDKLSDSLYQLRALFFREHIRALMITDYCQGMAMGFEYLPENRPFDDSLRKFHSIFQSEIMVVGISAQGEAKRESKEADICVEPSWSVSASQNVQAQVFLQHDLKNIPDLYRTLMEYLEDS